MQDRERQEREHEGSRHPFDRNGEVLQIDGQTRQGYVHHRRVDL